MYASYKIQREKKENYTNFRGVYMPVFAETWPTDRHQNWKFLHGMPKLGSMNNICWRKQSEKTGGILCESLRHGIMNAVVRSVGMSMGAPILVFVSWHTCWKNGPYTVPTVILRKPHYALDQQQKVCEAWSLRFLLWRSRSYVDGQHTWRGEIYFARPFFPSRGRSVIGIETQPPSHCRSERHHLN